MFTISRFVISRFECSRSSKKIGLAHINVCSTVGYFESKMCKKNRYIAGNFRLEF